MDERQQEIIYKINFFEQQINNLNSQLEVIEKASVEMISLKENLGSLRDQKNNEIFSHIGKGIYIKSKLISEDFLVDIGNKNFVKKNIGDTQLLIGEQIDKLKEVKKEINTNLDELNKEILKIIDEAQSQEMQKS